MAGSTSLDGLISELRLEGHEQKLIQPEVFPLMEVC